MNDTEHSDRVNASALSQQAGVGGAEGAEGATAAIQLAELVLSMSLATDKGLVARRLAREVLGIGDEGRAPPVVPITTNGTTRLVPRDEPVFLIRGQDAVGADAVRHWVAMASRNGAPQAIISAALEQARRMDAWPKKKTADLPINA